MTEISRRSVAKGAAWSVPAVAVASAAPALAASSACVTKVNCPVNPMKQEAGSSVYIQAITAGDGTYKGGSYISITSGEWIVPTAPTYTQTCGGASTTLTATGYYLYWGGTNSGTGPVSNVVASDGKSYQGKLTLSTPVGASPQTAGAGLSTSLGIQTSIPYNGDVCDAFSKGHILESVVVPFTLVFLNNLTPVGDCNYNMTFNFKPTGCQPNPATSVTMAAA